LWLGFSCGVVLVAKCSNFFPVLVDQFLQQVGIILVKPKSNAILAVCIGTGCYFKCFLLQLLILFAPMAGSVVKGRGWVVQEVPSQVLYLANTLILFFGIICVSHDLFII